MPLHSRLTVESATCDACGADLAPNAFHHGVLQSRFGFGSPLDNVGGAECVLCEACWRKACALLGLDPSTLERRTATVTVACAGCGQPILPGGDRVHRPDDREWHRACAPPPLPE